MSNLQFNADLDKFAQKLGDRVETVLTGVAVAIHGKIAEATPYRTGRARASWSITPNEPDPFPAPDILGRRYWDVSGAELAGANAFYDTVYAAKRRFVAPPGTRVVVVSNNLDYIEMLNAGSSRQAPAGFFEAAVVSFEGFVQAEIAKLPN